MLACARRCVLACVHACVKWLVVGYGSICGGRTFTSRRGGWGRGNCSISLGSVDFPLPPRGVAGGRGGGVVCSTRPGTSGRRGASDCGTIRWRSTCCGRATNLSHSAGEPKSPAAVWRRHRSWGCPSLSPGSVWLVSLSLTVCCLSPHASPEHRCTLAGSADTRLILAPGSGTILACR